MDFIVYLQKVGPFTAPLCVIGAVVVPAVIRHLLGRIAKLEKERDDSREEVKMLLKQAIVDKTDAAREYAEFGENMRTSMNQWDQRLAQALVVLEARGRT